VTEPARQRAGGSQIIPRPALWEPGPPAPWSHVEPAAHIDLDALCDRLQARGPGKPPPFHVTEARPSAVLIALFEGDGGAEVLLTRRSAHLRSHQGQVCFPGGRLDPGETATEAALREAHEEVLLDPAVVALVGELDQVALPVSSNHITPIVGRLARPPALTAGTEEVDRVFTVPLVDLLRHDTYREEQWFRDVAPWPVVFFELDDETIWGATARILRELLIIATAA
jgi:8-oxo-dGTP pyrophosphatase MutT (NUDIX family)